MAPLSTTTTLVENEIVCEKHEQKEYNTKDRRNKFLFWEFGAPLKWFNIIAITIFHVMAVYILLTHPVWKYPAIVTYCLVQGTIAGFGVTAGMHRLWTHRSFKAKKPLRILLLACFVMTGQNSPFDWVRDHRVHHKYSETDADPHNSRRGFFFAHVGWLMMDKHPEVLRRGKQIDFSDLFEDQVFVFFQRHFVVLKLLLAFIIPTIIPPLLWGESWIITIKAVIIAKYIISLNYIWLVNSAAHIWGNRPYDKNIFPAENMLVAFLALGEGYHNYHHAFPSDYRTSEIGKYFNITTAFLDFCQKIGWAYDMKEISPELLRKVIEKNGDSSHYRWGHKVPEEASYKEF